MDSLNSEECSAIDGTASGTCAEGYGVCCIGKIIVQSEYSTNFL